MKTNRLVNQEVFAFSKSTSVNFRVINPQSSIKEIFKAPFCVDEWHFISWDFDLYKIIFHDYLCAIIEWVEIYLSPTKSCPKQPHIIVNI